MSDCDHLAEALDTACNLLAVVGSVPSIRNGITFLVCGNCGTDWDSGDPGNSAAHFHDCDMPDVFRVRDEHRAAAERVKLNEEVNR